MSKYLTTNSKSAIVSKAGAQRNNFDIPANAHNEYGDSMDSGAPNSIIKIKPTEVDNNEPLNLEVGGARQRK